MEGSQERTGDLDGRVKSVKGVLRTELAGAQDLWQEAAPTSITNWKKARPYKEGSSARQGVVESVQAAATLGEAHRGQ